MLVQLSRAAFQYQARARPEEAALLANITALKEQHPRYGERRVWALLRRKHLISGSFFTPDKLQQLGVPKSHWLK